MQQLSRYEYLQTLFNMDKHKKIIDIIPPSSTRFIPKQPEQIKEEETQEKEKFETEPEIEPEIELETEPRIEPEIERKNFFPKESLFSKIKRKKKLFIFIPAACLIVAGVIFCFTLSKAEIAIKPKAETMQFQVELNIDKNIAFIDLGNNKIPGQLFQVEKEGQKEFPATQEKELEEKARGTITVYNQYSSSSQTLVKSTRFISKSGKIFKTIETIVIPGAQVEQGQIIPSSIDVAVEAAEPGKDYNIEPSSFTIPGFKGTAKYNGFYGKSSQPMTGGIVGKVRVVSEEDIQGAKDILSIELKEKAKKELEKRIPSDLKILKDATLEEIKESSSSVEANQPAEKFTLKIKVAAKVLGFNEDDAISLINDNLKEKISKDKSLIPDSIELEYTTTDINLEKGTAGLTCQIKEDVAWKIDIEKIKQELKGKSEANIRQYLISQPEIDSAKIIFWPFWVKKMPSKESKIKITITQ